MEGSVWAYWMRTSTRASVNYVWMPRTPEGKRLEPKPDWGELEALFKPDWGVPEGMLYRMKKKTVITDTWNICCMRKNLFMVQVVYDYVERGISNEQIKYIHF